MVDCERCEELRMKLADAEENVAYFTSELGDTEEALDEAEERLQQAEDMLEEIRDIVSHA